MYGFIQTGFRRGHYGVTKTSLKKLMITPTCEKNKESKTLSIPDSYLHSKRVK